VAELGQGVPFAALDAEQLGQLLDGDEDGRPRSADQRRVIEMTAC